MNRLYPFESGRRKSDLVAQVDEVAYLVDVSITSDTNDMSCPHEEIVSYYRSRDVIDWVAKVLLGGCVYSGRWP